MSLTLKIMDLLVTRMFYDNFTRDYLSIPKQGLLRLPYQQCLFLMVSLDYAHKGVFLLK